MTTLRRESDHRGGTGLDVTSDSVDSALAAVAQRCLSGRGELYTAWIQLVRNSGRYKDAWVDQEEVRAKALEVFELILRRIAGEKVSEDLATVSARVGRRRAEQAVSLGEVQAAANMDFQIVWEAMLEEADADEAAAMLRGAPSIWAVVDDHTRGITQAYQQRRDELERLSGDLGREWFGRLLKCNGERRDVVQRAAEVLGLDLAGRFKVVIAHRDYAPRFRQARDTLAALRWDYYYQEVEVGDLMLVDCGTEQETRLLNCLAEVGCAIAPTAHGLDEVPRATTIASDILTALPRDRACPGFLEDSWFAVAAAQAPLVAQALAERIQTALDGIPDASLLIETARVFCDGDGTISRAASELHCHRNTVLNRLEKLRGLTGYDVRSPRDAAAFLFATNARQDWMR